MKQPIALWNFDLSHEGDRGLYEQCSDSVFRSPREARKRLEKLVKSQRENHVPLSTDDVKESSPGSLAKLIRLLEEQRDNAWDWALEAEKQHEEAICLLAALDVKISVF